MPTKKKPTKKPTASNWAKESGIFKPKKSKDSLDMMVMGNMPMGIEKIPDNLKAKKVAKKAGKKG